MLTNKWIIGAALIDVLTYSALAYTTYHWVTCSS